jgi:hypothetical protein
VLIKEEDATYALQIGIVDFKIDLVGLVIVGVLMLGFSIWPVFSSIIATYFANLTALAFESQLR